MPACWRRPGASGLCLQSVGWCLWLFMVGAGVLWSVCVCVGRARDLMVSHVHNSLVLKAWARPLAPIPTFSRPCGRASSLPWGVRQSSHPEYVCFPVCQ